MNFKSLKYIKHPKYKNYASGIWSFDSTYGCFDVDIKDYTPDIIIHGVTKQFNITEEEYKKSQLIRGVY